MAILGSRDRLCIHKNIRNRDPSGVEPTKNVNVNQECRTRVGNTELMRKRMWQSSSQHYDDDNPPERLELDSAEAPQAQAAEEGQDWIDTGAKNNDKPCCPHYRQLSTTRTASLAYEKFVPQNPNCCTRGGEHTKLGSHDIEDLVEFGKDPYVKRGVAVYRDTSKGSFGMQIGKFGNAIRVTEIYNDGAIAQEGTVRLQDEILTLNGHDTRGQTIDKVANIMRSTEDPLLLDVTSDSTLDVNESGYSQHSPCPYYLSRALANHAELIFCPYNYVLDPSIRKSLGIELEGAIVVLGTCSNAVSFCVASET
jgi:Fanconi anemia group J protein